MSLALKPTHATIKAYYETLHQFGQLYFDMKEPSAPPSKLCSPNADSAPNPSSRSFPNTASSVPAAPPSSLTAH
jgi:hypothetical protein